MKHIGRKALKKLMLWVYKLHFTKQGLFTIFAFQNLQELINCDIKSYLNLCTFAVFHLNIRLLYNSSA